VRRSERNPGKLYICAGLAARLAVALAASALLGGCNAGLGALLAVLLTDDDGGHHKAKSGELASLEFVALENGRLHPAQSVIVLNLRSSKEKATSVDFAYSTDSGATYQPASVQAPLGSTMKTPGTVQKLATSTQGVEHRIPWNALFDVGGTDDLHNVRLRFTGGIDQPQEVDVLVGNDAPSIQDLTLAQAEEAPVEMQVVVTDSSGDPVDLQVDFATEEDDLGNRLFHAAQIVTGNLALASSAAGTAHPVAWNAVAEVGAFDRVAALRLTPLDRIGGEVGKIGTPVVRVFSLDNNAAPTADVLDEDILTDPDQRGQIAVHFVVRDLDGDPVDAVVQWARGDDPFEPLGAEFDTNAAAREAALADPENRRLLHVASFVRAPIEGPVEAAPPGTTLGTNEVLATWIKSAAELRGLAGNCARGGCVLIGRNVRIQPPTGAEVERVVCGYSPETGVLTLDTELDPSPPAGSRMSIDLGGDEGSLRLASTIAGTERLLVWDSAGEIPGGGSVRFRVTPFDRVAAADAGCTARPGSEAPGISAGARGAASDAAGAKRVRGPFRDEAPWSVPLAPIDDPVAITSLDVDADGLLDVACAARGSNTVVLLRQSEPGVFDPVRLSDARLRSISGLVVDDLEGDGDLDIAVSDDDGGKVLLIYEAAPDDYFSQRSVLTAQGALRRPTAISAADLDGDGDRDLAVSLAGGAGANGVRIFLRGGGPSACTTSEAGYTSCYLDDPNGDEPNALAAGKITDAVSDMVTAGSGFFALYSLRFTGGQMNATFLRIPAPGTDLRSVAIADLDKSGSADLIAPDRANHSLRVATQTNGSFNLLAPIVSTNLRGPLGVTGGDLDSSGTEDIVVSDPGDPAGRSRGNVCVFLGSASGEYSADALLPPERAGASPSSPVAAAIGDFDGDGRPDIAAADAGSKSVVIFRQGGVGSFGEARVLADGQIEPSPSSLAAGDVNGDQRMDFVAPSREADALMLYEQVGGGAFAALSLRLPATVQATRRGPVAAAVGDVDGDGRGDIVCADVDANDLLVLVQDARGDFTTTELSADGFLGPHSVALADVDGDGRLDVAAAARFSDEARWFRQDDTGAFAEAGAFRAGEGAGPKLLGPVFVALADIDGDGQTDVVTANHRSSNLTVFVQDTERGKFRAPLEVALGVGLRPVGVEIGDYDASGTPDIAAVHLGSSAVSVFLQASDGTLSGQTLPAVSGLQPTSIAAADLDSTGKPSLAVAYSSHLGSFIQTYAQDASARFLPEPTRRLSSPDVVAPVAVQAVDVDGDGEADLTTANRQSRNVTTFFCGR